MGRTAHSSSSAKEKGNPGNSKELAFESKKLIPVQIGLKTPDLLGGTFPYPGIRKLVKGEKEIISPASQNGRTVVGLRRWGEDGWAAWGKKARLSITREVQKKSVLIGAAGVCRLKMSSQKLPYREKKRGGIIAQWETKGVVGRIRRGGGPESRDPTIIQKLRKKGGVRLGFPLRQNQVSKRGKRLGR